MALFMNRDDLEAIRPAHVSMGAMRLWYATRTGMVLSLCLLPVGVIGMCFARPMAWVLAAGFAGLAASELAWLASIVLCFARFSLRTLMLIVVATAAQVALLVALPGGYVRYVGFVLVVWLVVLYGLVVDRDPQRNAPVALEQPELGACYDRGSDAEAEE